MSKYFYNCINEFYSIKEYINTIIDDNNKILIIFDIDETILKYNDINKHWWKNKFNYYYNLTNSFELADELSTKDWIIHIHENEPTHTELNSFNELLNLIDKHKHIIDIEFLTARNDILKAITIKHLQKFLPRNLNIHINFSNGGNKVKYINNKYNNIIFIDDLLSNLQDVYEVYNNKVVYYLFEMKN